MSIKKVGYKIVMHEPVREWVTELERKTGITKTRLMLTAMLALSTRDRNEREHLTYVATMVDNGEVTWNQALACLRTYKGRIELDNAVNIVTDVQDPTFVAPEINDRPPPPYHKSRERVREEVDTERALDEEIQKRRRKARTKAKHAK